MTDLAELHADTQGAALYIWGALAGTRPAPVIATLRTLVARALEESDAGAFKVEIQLADGRWLYADEIRQLHSRFEAER